jgi:hypothetical protein
MYIHRHCYAALRRTASATSPLKCPACGTDWSNAETERPKGKLRGKRTAGVRQMGEWSVPDGYEDAFLRRKRRSAAASEEDRLEDDEMDAVVDAVVEEEELESDPPTPPPAKGKRGKLVKKGNVK